MTSCWSWVMHTQGMQSLPHQDTLHNYSYRQDDCKVSSHITWTFLNILKTYNGIPLSSSSNIDCNVEHNTLINIVTQTWKLIWPNIYVMAVLLSYHLTCNSFEYFLLFPLLTSSYAILKSSPQTFWYSNVYKL